MNEDNFNVVMDIITDFVEEIKEDSRFMWNAFIVCILLVLIVAECAAISIVMLW